MRKDELRKLRSLPATKQMMEKGKRYKTKKVQTYSGRYTRTIPEYDALFRVQNLSGYIKVAVFLPEDMRKNIKTPRYEIFLNVDGEEYLTRELDENGKEKRWSDEMMKNLEGVPGFGYWSNTKYFVGRDGMNTLNGLKPSDGNDKQKGIYRLIDWQQAVKDAATRRKEQREQAPWDKDMSMIPEIPKTFEEWMRRNAADEYYIFYEYSKKGAEVGYCSKCKKYVPIKKPKNKKETRCPACKTKAVFRSNKKIQGLVVGDYYAEIIQKFSEGIVIRKFKQRQWYRGSTYDNPHVHTEEMERILLLDNGAVKRYEWGDYKQKYHRWIFDADYFPQKETYWWIRRVKLYKRNLSQLKKTTLLGRSAFDLWPELPTSMTNYLEIERMNPAIEMLARIGMFRLAKGIIDERYDVHLLAQGETELAKMLKLDKSRLKRLREMDGNVYHLRWMQYEKFANTIWPDQMIKDLGEAEILSSGFGFLDSPIRYVKCYNYLKKQAAIMRDTLEQARITWRDYLNMADSLKMNTKNDQIARPKDVKRAHDELVLIKQKAGLEKQARQIEKKWPKVNKQLPKLKKFGFTDGGYTIVVPEKVLDIVREGTLLGHCVHTCDYYFDRIQKDESYLFFLRKSDRPDMPWYTLEVEPSGNIRQKRTTGDNQNEDLQRAMKFLQKWQKFFKKQLTEEEKKLGDKANKMRIENYKNLRENGNKVWHGRLAGQLLADVLESDFMEAM